MNLRAWLERFAFSFVVVGICLFWMAYQIYSGRESGTSQRVAAYTVVGALLLGVGCAGIRLRHRRRD
ncbi:MAG TPA: hypothetical protein VFE58_15580 [Tepidisphaeraceae bacterium]|jgi:hypothetical protein|nr:hypothetical protein [Tepidisphaeraceae bacterium]